MPYSSTSLNEILSRLQDRLDSKAVFFTNDQFSAYPEIQLYLKEAVRFWNCLATKYRERFVFQTVAGQAFYNLNDPALVVSPSNLVAHTVTTQDLIAEMQFHLMEPLSPSVWAGTDMFTMEQIVLVYTGVEQEFDNSAFTVLGSGRFEFPEGWMDIRRLEWVDLDGIRTHLWRSDEWSRDSLDVGWALNSDPTPTQFSIILTNPLRIQLMPAPALPGTMERIVTKTGVTLDAITNPLIGVPDDWTWAVKWGAMADLLGMENQARDPARAAYCESRYAMGVELCMKAPTVLHALINGMQAPLVSIEELDTQAPGWTNIPGPPDTIGVSEDMLALSPVPDGVYSITMDVLRTAPFGDPIQVALEEQDAVLDYAHHIGTFKEGGVEFKATMRNLKNIVQQATVFNERLSAMSFYRELMEERSRREDERRARREPVEQIVDIEL